MRVRHFPQQALETFRGDKVNRTGAGGAVGIKPVGGHSMTSGESVQMRHYAIRTIAILPPPVIT